MVQNNLKNQQQKIKKYILFLLNIHVYFLKNIMHISFMYNYKKTIKNITIKIPYLIEKNMMGENDF
jgi:hypothetical protein